MLENEAASARFARYRLGEAYDEMFDGADSHRLHYAGIHERLCSLPIEHWRERQRAADVAFVTQGITFTVYGQAEGVERIFPFDLRAPAGDRERNGRRSSEVSSSASRRSISFFATSITRDGSSTPASSRGRSCANAAIFGAR